jgi:hypothetical protein
MIFAGPAHGERPIVNGKAGVLSASGSTPPSGTNTTSAQATPRSFPTNPPDVCCEGSLSDRAERSVAFASATIRPPRPPALANATFSRGLA